MCFCHYQHVLWPLSLSFYHQLRLFHLLLSNSIRDKSRSGHFCQLWLLHFPDQQFFWPFKFSLILWSPLAWQAPFLLRFFLLLFTFTRMLSASQPWRLLCSWTAAALLRVINWRLTPFKGEILNCFLLVIFAGLFVFEIIFKRALYLTSRKLIVKHNFKFLNVFFFYARLRLFKVKYELKTYSLAVVTFTEPQMLLLTRQSLVLCQRLNGLILRDILRRNRHSHRSLPTGTLSFCCV